MATSPYLQLPIPELTQTADGPDAFDDLARAVEDWAYRRILPTGVNRYVGHHWGNIDSQAAFPASAQGAQSGDTLYVPTLLCTMIYVNGAWQQAHPSMFATFAAMETARTTWEAAGGVLHNGFLAFDSANDTLWAASGGSGSVDVWRYVGGHTYGGATISSESALTAAGGTIAAGWALSNLYLRRIGGYGYCDITATRTGAAISVPVDGNVANTAICTLPDAVRPPLNQMMMATGGGPLTSGWLATSGVVTLAAIAPGSSLATNSTVQLMATQYPLANPARAFTGAFA